MQTTVPVVRLDGFATAAAQAGELPQILKKGWATSDSPIFYVYAEQIANLVFPQLGLTKDQVDRYLLIIHPDDTADIYIQDFPVTTRVRVSRPVEAGEQVFSTDVSDIEEVRFPGISMARGDRVIYFARQSWRFGIFFDFTRETDADQLARDVAQMQRGLSLDDILQKTLAALRDPTRVQFDAFILTEGKTDWRHLQTAFKALGYGRSLWYETSDKDRGDTQLLDACKALALTPHDKPIVCIFDRDNEAIAKELARQASPEPSYQDWGNNVFSLMLPVPDHRTEYMNISTEMLYSDEVLGRQTADGKRLCFNNEVRTEIVAGKVTKVVLILPNPEMELTKKVVTANLDRIEDASGQKIGLSKARFAELIASRSEPFSNVDFTAFQRVADVLERLFERSAPKIAK